MHIYILYSPSLGSDKNNVVLFIFVFISLFRCRLVTETVACVRASFHKLEIGTNENNKCGEVYPNVRLLYDTLNTLSYKSNVAKSERGQEEDNLSPGDNYIARKDCS